MWAQSSSMTFLLFIILIFALRRAVSEEESESENSNDKEYLYTNDADPIIDYRADNNKQLDPQKPDFLFGENQPARIVEFYAPWCPHCLHFRDHYVHFARQISILAEDQGQKVNVYAVSCTVWKNLCHEFDVHGYPKLKLFAAGATNVTADAQYYAVHPFDVLKKLGIQISAQNSTQVVLDGGLRKTKKEKEAEDLLKVYKASKDDVFSDAWLSFDFALHNSIFVSNEPLNEKRKRAFHEWLNLLQKSMPPTWQMQVLIQDLLDNIENVSRSEKELLEVTERHPPPHKTWSKSCRHGKTTSASYPCGLWRIFHLMTIGVVEYNLLIIDNDALVLGIEECANILRNYIENFFACEECRLNFLHEYDSCSYDRCHRLYDQAETREEWIQLPLWLNEFHNAINVRLLHEKAERESLSVSVHDEIKVQWPPRDDCPKCWRKDGGWHEEEMYKYLRIMYWPEDTISSIYRRELSLDLKDQEDDDRFNFALPSALLSVLPFALLLGLLAGWYIRSAERRRTGMHKRVE